MLPTAITKAAEVKSEAERRLTKQLMESEKGCQRTWVYLSISAVYSL